MPAPKTKQCEVCDTVIAESETKCPNALCGADLTELEENIKAVSQANAVIAKRKAKETPVPAPAPAGPTSTLARLRALRKKA